MHSSFISHYDVLFCYPPCCTPLLDAGTAEANLCSEGIYLSQGSLRGSQKSLRRLNLFGGINDDVINYIDDALTYIDNAQASVDDAQSVSPSVQCIQ